MEHLLKQLNDNMTTVVDKLDKQGTVIAELVVKVDLYRESQNQMTHELKEVNRVSAEAMQSTKAAHNRIDGFEDEVPTNDQFKALDDRVKRIERVNWLIGSTVAIAVIGAVMSLIIISK